MKKIYILLIVALIASASCSKQSDPMAGVDTSGHTIFNVDTEQVDFEGKSMVSKWKAGDRIGVFGSQQGNNVAYELKRSGQGLRDASFYGPLVKGSVSAYYPYSEYTALEDGKIPFVLNSTQTFFPSEDPVEAFLANDGSTFAYAQSDNTLHFLYPMGLLAVKFTFEESILIHSLSLTGNDGIAGKLLVDGDGGVKASGISMKTIAMDFGDATVATKKADGSFTTFYFVLPPANYATGDLSLNVRTEDEAMSVVLKSIEIKRVKANDFSVANISVSSSDIPGFGKQDGYLE